MTTNVGVFRALYGDTVFEKYDPDEPGRGNYKAFSDNEIEGFLAAGDNSVNRAVGFAYLALAGRAAEASKNVKDQDLSIDTTKRPTELRLIAQSWFDRAKSEDEEAYDAFEIAEVGTCSPIPEGSLVMVGRRYTWGPIC